jgi:hypothetical protein
VFDRCDPYGNRTRVFAVRGAALQCLSPDSPCGADPLLFFAIERLEQRAVEKQGHFAFPLFAGLPAGDTGGCGAGRSDPI